MKIALLLIFLLLAEEAFPSAAIVQKPLDEFIVYEVPVAEVIGNTTILFPSPISGIFASKASPSVQANADFLIDYQPGSYYFTIRSIKPNTQDYINVIFEKKAYVLHIVSSKQPYRTLTFFSGKDFSKKNKIVTPELLLSLLDKAKSYSLLESQHPGSLEGVMHEVSNKQFDYKGYSILLNDIYRFEEADTLIFRITLENKTDSKKVYDPQNVSIGLKENLYSTSIADASGDIPPNSTVIAYFGITGTATGRRNNLAPKNDWNIILNAHEEQESPSPYPRKK